MGLYDDPKYYDIAFSFRCYEAEVDIMEEVIRRHSRIAVGRVLDVACGHAPHLIELRKRGYDYVGVDRKDTMLEYARRNAARFTDGIQLVEADIAHFSLEAPVDFGFVMLGSLYLENTAELVSHFDAVGRALEAGGLYFLDWCVDFDPLTDLSNTWTCERDGIKVKTTYHTTVVDRVEQTVRETVLLEVDDRGEHKTIKEEAVKRIIYPQEFLLFIRQHPDFEFVGWWNEWDLSKPMTGLEPGDRPIIVIRRLAS